MSGASFLGRPQGILPRLFLRRAQCDDHCNLFSQRHILRIWILRLRRRRGQHGARRSRSGVPLPRQRRRRHGSRGGGRRAVRRRRLDALCDSRLGVPDVVLLKDVD